MDLGRATKFGSLGATGVILISLVTYGLVRMAWADRIAGSEGMALGTVLVVGVAGMGVAILLLFVVIGAFLDRELDARGLDGSEE